MQYTTRRKAIVGLGGIIGGTLGGLHMASGDAAAIDVQTGTMQVSDAEHTGTINEVIATLDVEIEYESDTASDIELALEAGERHSDPTTITTDTHELDGTSGTLETTIEGDILESSSLRSDTWELIVGQDETTVEVSIGVVATLLSDGETVAEATQTDIASITRHEQTGDVTLTVEGEFAID